MKKGKKKKKTKQKLIPQSLSELTRSASAAEQTQGPAGSEISERSEPLEVRQRQRILMHSQPHNLPLGRKPELSLANCQGLGMEM